MSRAVRSASPGHLEASLHRALAPATVLYAEIGLRLRALGALGVL